MILHPPKKLNEIFHLEVEPMFDDVKKKIVAHRGVLSHTVDTVEVEVDTTMILMTIVLERRTRDVSRPLQYNWHSIDMQQEIAVETTHRPASQARLNHDGNQNVESR